MLSEFHFKTAITKKQINQCEYPLLSPRSEMSVITENSSLPSKYTHKLGMACKMFARSLSTKWTITPSVRFYGKLISQASTVQSSKFIHCVCILKTMGRGFVSRKIFFLDVRKSNLISASQSYCHFWVWVDRTFSLQYPQLYAYADLTLNSVCLCARDQSIFHPRRILNTTMCNNSWECRQPWISGHRFINGLKYPWMNLLILFGH